MYSYPPKKTNDHFNILKQTNNYLFDKTTPKPYWKLTHDTTRGLFFKPVSIFYCIFMLWHLISNCTHSLKHTVLWAVMICPRFGQTEVNIIHVVLISHKFQFLIGGYCHSFKITNRKLWERNVLQSGLEVIHRARLLYLKL